jgi:hypothetical protein
MAADTIDVATFLEDRAETILDAARQAVQRRALGRYEADGIELTTDRLRILFDLAVRCARRQDTQPVQDYAAQIGFARQRAGYELAQVQSVINVLEEQMWKAVIDGVPPEHLGYALGVVSTILGVAKSRMAVAFLDATGSKPTRSLRLDYLFGGTEAMALPDDGLSSPP